MTRTLQAMYVMKRPLESNELRIRQIVVFFCGILELNIPYKHTDIRAHAHTDTRTI